MTLPRRLHLQLQLGDAIGGDHARGPGLVDGFVRIALQAGMRHRGLVIALGGLDALPGILAAAEDVPVATTLRLSSLKCCGKPRVSWPSLPRASSATFGMKAPAAEWKASRAASLSACAALMVGLSVSVTARTLVFRGRQSGQAARAAQVVRLDADHLAEFGARVLEAAAEFGQRNFGGVDAFAWSAQGRLVRRGRPESAARRSQDASGAPLTFSWARATRRV